MFLGLAQLRLGELEHARSNFQRAVAKDQRESIVGRYYLGVVAYQEGHWSEAQEDFTAVVAATPDSDVGREAVTFLTKIRAGQRPLYTASGAV